MHSAHSPIQAWLSLRTRLGAVAAADSGFALLAAAVALVAAFLHYAALTSSPPGLYVDEASVGYEAFAISADGRDEHGVSWPLFFQALGEYRSPVAVYLLAVPVRLLGLSDTLVRALPSTYTLLTAAILAVLVWQIFRARWLALGTFATLAFVPWLFVIGRIGFETTSLLPFLALFLVAWWRADRTGSWVAALLAGIFLAISLYAYSTMRLLVAILLVALWVAYSTRLRRFWAPLVAVSAVCGLAYLEMLVWAQAHPGALTSRFQLVSIFADNPSTATAVDRFFRIYSSDFSPAFLFYSGDPWLRHSTERGGVLFATLLPLLGFGIVGLWRLRLEPYWRFVAISIVVAPVPAALTTDFSHSLRTISVVPFLTLAMALGAFEAANRLRPDRVLPLAFCALLVIEGGSFLSDYFSTYPSRIPGWFDAGLEPAVDDAAQMAGERGSQVVLTDRIDQPRILYAYFRRESPEAYRRRDIEAAGATVGPVTRTTYSPGTIVVAKPDETVPNATLVRQETLPATDAWGRPLPAIVSYNLWLVGG